MQVVWLLFWDILRCLSQRISTKKKILLKVSLLFQIVLKLAGDMFEVELPDGQEVQFPNRDGMDVINYIKIAGDFKLTSFKIC